MLRLGETNVRTRCDEAFVETKALFLGGNELALMSTKLLKRKLFF